MRRFVWTAEREQAIMLARSGRYTQAQIAQQIGVSRRAVEGWARRPEWKAKRKAMSDASFAELQQKANEDARALAASASTYERKPRGTRSHKRMWYKHAHQQLAEQPPPAAPIRAQPPQRSAEEA